MGLDGNAFKSAILASSTINLHVSPLFILAGIIGLAELRGAWRLAGAAFLLGSLIAAALNIHSIITLLLPPLRTPLGVPGSAIRVVSLFGGLLFSTGLAGLALAVTGRSIRGLAAAALALSLLLLWLLFPEIASLLGLKAPGVTGLRHLLSGALFLAAAILLALPTREG